MAISNKITHTHGGGDGKPPPKKPSIDTNAKEIRTKKKNDKDRSRTPTEVDIEATEQMRASKPPSTKKRKVIEVQGKGKAKKTVESESDVDSSDDDDRPVWTSKFHPDLPRMLEVLCDDSGKAQWSKRKALSKTYMAREARAWLNWILNRWMPATHKSEMVRTRKNMQWSLYFVHRLTALLEKYELAETSDELIGDTEMALHDTCSVQDPTEESIEKKGYGQRITPVEHDIQQLRLELEARDRVDLVELEEIESSATDGTPPTTIEIVATGHPSTGEGDLIEAVDASGFILEDPAAPMTDVQDRSSPQAESS
ncbi:hypothetical protein RND71_026382 [Anisodus tanguticus]|uniref:Uncharacterized protein n=1 Tax=Anisodus tanguticus TaxID=243964 RepID=A0AAE1V2T8_9SOLA|nr:hypothetical protein RND71_026382 [Anisodus tanguticus]